LPSAFVPLGNFFPGAAADSPKPQELQGVLVLALTLLGNAA
jgi:hypothetical protein